MVHEILLDDALVSHIRLGIGQEFPKGTLVVLHHRSVERHRFVP
jgi:hypothetical protein